MERAFRPDKYPGEGVIQVHDNRGRSRTERLDGDQYPAQLDRFAARAQGVPGQDTDNNGILEQASLIDAYQRALRSGRAETPERP